MVVGRPECPPASETSSPYRRFFEALADAAFIVDERSGQLVDANEAALRMYATTREGLDERTVKLRQEGAPVVTPGRSVAVEEHARADGTRFMAEATAATVEVDGRRLVMGVVRDVSERERVARALRHNRALLEMAFDESPLLMTIGVWPGGELLEVNAAFCAGFGFTREEVRGRTTLSLSIIAPEVRQLLARELQTRGRVDGIEFDCVNRHGRPLRLRYWAEVIHTSQGLRMYAAGEDITERVHSERARDEALARLQKIACSVPGVMYQFRLHPDGRTDFPYASSSIRSIFGVTPEQVKADAGAVWSRIHEDDLPAVQASVFESGQALLPWQHEFRVRDDDGRVRWVLGKALPEREPEGVVLWHGFITDVTERRREEDALRVSEERFSLAVDATSDGIWDLDYARGKYFCSPRYFRMLGYEPGEFEPTPAMWHAFVHPDDHPAAAAALLRCRDGGAERFEAEHRIRTKQGEWRWVLSRGRCLARGPDGKALRLVGTVTDVTEQRRLQAGLAQSDRLASMGLLAAGVAHEINNPLAYVLSNLEHLAHDLPRLVGLARRCAAAVEARRGAAGLAEVLGRTLPAFTGTAPDELLESAQSALEGTRRIRKISRTLGTFSRVDRAERRDVDLTVALETAATMAGNEVRFRATLVKELEPVPLVRASEGKLAQVFLNLLINAAQAIPEGHVGQHRITVRTRADDESVYAEVHDTGRGIAPEHLERVFEPFFTTKQLGVGSGLGLTLSRNIVRELGGEIHLESTPGVGTRAVVRLPRTEALLPSPMAFERPTPVPHRRGRVLVIDDEAPIRRALVRALGRLHEVVAVESGQAAQALLGRDPRFDVVLCDLMMPQLTGTELHGWLERHHPGLATRVIFLTGGAFTPHAAEYLARVGNARLEKPFDQAELQAAIAQRVAHG